ncbi:MAG: RDD family protein, partial [Planctomycetes bacterium]|nr:RDD family protein [Planctomycetota bacterium]
MATQVQCRGCRRELPQHQYPFLRRPEYNVWAREGYCSYFCFIQTAPPELIREDEEVENRRQQAVSGLEARPERVELAPQADDLEPASVGARILARLIDTAVGGILVFGALPAILGRIPGIAGAPGEAGAAAPGGLAAWLRETALLQSWAHWQTPAAFALGSILFFTLCQTVSGTTPAKRLFGLEVVTESGRRASL